MSKTVFSDRVKSYLKAAGYSQKVLAKELSMDSSVLTHKLNGTGRTILTYPEVREIVKALAKLEAITAKSEALLLLAEAECPRFAAEEWKNYPLNKLSPDQEAPFYEKNHAHEQGQNVSIKSSANNPVENPGIAPETHPTGVDGPSLNPAKIPNNLPRALNTFVGREHEINEVIQLLTGPGSTRLLTLTGVGGTGKTRLSLAIARRFLNQNQFSGGIFFISLETITGHAELINELAQTLEVQDTAGKSQLEALKGYLAEKMCLLILDNFEQLVPVAPLLIELLNGSAGLKLLVTSRIALHLSLEQEYPVEPLPLPPDRLDLDLAGVSENAAVALFSLRAKTVSPGFYLEEENKTAVVKICRKLDGLPLAIELAAAKVRVLPPQKLLERLSLKILSGGPKDLPARQQTLQETIELSYRLLTPAEQRLFAQLSIFAGGFTLDGAEAVCNTENDLDLDLFEGIESLLMQNFLLRREGANGEPRYGMLQTILEYGQEKLRERGEFAQINERYIDYYVEMAEKIEPELSRKEQGTFLRLLDNEYDNYRAILSYIFTQIIGNIKYISLTEKALKLVASLGQYWHDRGYLSEGRLYLEEALALAENDEKLKYSSSMAKVLHSLGLIFVRQANIKLAGEYFEKSLISSRGSKNLFLIATTLYNLSHIWENLGNYNKARKYAEESLEIYQEIGDKQGIARITYTVGWMYFWPGNNETGRPYFEGSLQLAKELEDNYLIIFATNSLALLKTYAEGDTFTAYQNSQKALTLSRELGVTYCIAYSLLALGMIAFAAGDYETAHLHFEENLALCLETGDKRQIFAIKLYLGEVAFAKRNYAKAFELFLESLKICREINAISYFAFILAGFAGIGYVQIEQGSNSDKSKLLLYCARMCGIIHNLLASVGLKLRQPEIGYYEKALATARSHLSEETFNSAFKEGQSMELEEALDYALSLERRVYF